MSDINPVGKVSTDRIRAEDDNWGTGTSKIILNKDFDETALKGIEEFSHLEILYLFHKVSDDKVERGARHPRNLKHLPETGIFAQRGKNRPNKIGLTTVKLVKVEGTTLYVKGLDAIDGTPVLDIKPVMKQFMPKGEVKQPKWVDEIMKNYW